MYTTTPRVDFDLVAVHHHLAPARDVVIELVGAFVVSESGQKWARTLFGTVAEF
jgi:hypothetical protein